MPLSSGASPLHIAFDMTLPARVRTGTWVYATELVAAMQRLLGHDITILNHAKRWPGVTPVQKALNAADLTLWMQASLPRQLRRLGVDVLHSPSFIAPALSPCATVVSILDTTHLSAPTSRLWGLYAGVFTALAARRAAAVITLSESSKGDIIDEYHVPSDRVAVVPLGVSQVFRVLDDAAREAVRRKYDLTEPFILFVSALERRKNVPTLLRAFARLKQLEPGLPHRLVMVGQRGAAWPEIEQTLREVALNDAVRYLGHVPAEDLPRLYNAAELFVFPSLYEGFGLPVLEAMACGTAVITSNVSSLPEVGGDAAIYVNPNHVDDISHALQRVLLDGDLRQALGARGVERAAHFTWEHSAQLTLAVYEDVYLRQAHAVSR